MKKNISICRPVTLREVFNCSFNLNTTEYLVLRELLRSKTPKSVLQLAKKLKKDRTTIQKAIANLLKENLIKRKQLNLEKGGYFYLYFIEDKNKLKNTLIKNLDLWYRDVINMIRSL